MADCSNSLRSLWLGTVLCLFGARALSAQQTATVPRLPISGGYRISGTVVSKTDLRPLARSRITLRDEKDPNKFESMITGEDGKFEFTSVPVGKYSLGGARRGFIAASYDQHDQFSTAIVTGAGLDTETLVLRLAPDAVIAGKVLDEAGEPVRHAAVTLYYDDHTSGVDQVRQTNLAQTNDLGEYEMTPLRPGTYFLSASAKPWYAVHPPSESSRSGSSKNANAESDQDEVPPAVDRSLDVAYPVTYYPDVTDTDDALPIPIRGGERVEADIHFSPVPSLRMLFRVPDTGNRGSFFPQLEQPAFDGYTHVQTTSITRSASPGLVEVTGIPAGRYNIRLFGQGQSLQMNGVDLTKDGDEVDASKADAVGSVKVSVQIPGEAALPSGLTVGLRSGNRMVAASSCDSKGEAELKQIAVGRYEVAVWGGGKRYAIVRMSAEGAEVSGHTLTIAAGSSPSILLTLVSGSVEIRGTATHAGKGLAGAMVVLVPKDPAVNRDLFRRDQSDLDGTFTLRSVVPGAYTLLAIENGWDLEWSQPGVIAAYLKHGRKIEVGGQGKGTMNVAEAIEVQSK